MRARHLVVPRTARYYAAGPTDRTPSEAWIVFHGYGFLASRFARAFEPIDDGNRLIVVPEALSRFYLAGTAGQVGASWMTKEDRDREIHDQVAYLDALADHLNLDGIPTHLLGFSQGSATACRWLARGRVTPLRLIVWGGEIPPDLDWRAAGERFRRLDEVVLVTGTDDPYAPPGALEAFAGLLTRHRVRHRTMVFPGGHRIEPGTLQRLATGG